MNKKRIIIIVSVVLLLLMLLPILAVSAVLGVNAYVKDIGGSYIISPEEAVKLSDVEAAEGAEIPTYLFGAVKDMPI